ncbi:SPOSA6832_04686 [Sporobolomyces salmonicolor]|uniref:SPOSA6832_04686-mRNA-1:cds n=1 Tax=Sporidiobolus salmonicolor TaxID=5005 RepID=A0A0D6ERT3_SPOSA|nr:SPOSA6832_04686 [Sporobolomyces salmonicolor]
MHTPFSLSSLIPPSVLGNEPVTVALLYDVVLQADRVMLGTDKGSLLVFDLSHPSTSASPPVATLVSRHDGFCRKAIDQLSVIKELNALVCMSGGDLILYSLPDLSLLSSFATQTRGTASLFALSTEIHHPSSTSPGIPEIHTTLALACRRRLILLSWVDGTWNPQVEVSLPHQIRGMAFEGRKIVAGFSTGEYGIVTLPPLEGKGAGEAPVLGDLFSLPLPIAEKTTKAGVPGLSGLGGLGLGAGLGALSGLALGKKLEKNGVAGVPRAKGKAKMPQQIAARAREPENAEDGWLWGEEHRSSAPRSAPIGSPAPTPPSIVYPSLVDETIVVPPYIVSLLAPSPPSSSDTSASTISSATFSLSINALESLSSVQNLPVPPRSDSPPSSIAASTRTSTDPSSATPKPPQHIARLLTASSSSPSPPILVLTAAHADPTSAGAPGPLLEQTLWIGTMKSWQSQIEELGQQGAWEEGIELLRRSGMLWGRDSLPRPMLRRLAIIHSLHLFKSCRYPLAIDAFISLNISPARVVALYPVPISGKLFLEPSAHEEIFDGRPRDKVVAAIVDQEAMGREEKEQKRAARDDVETSRAGTPSSPAKRGKGPSAATAADNDDAMSIRSVGSRLAAKRSWLRERDRDREPSATLDEIAEKAAAEKERQAKLDAQNYSRSVDELIRYLTDRRQKYSQALAALLPSARPAPSTPRPRASSAELLELPNEPLTSLTPEQLARVAQVVDTALFRSYLATKPVMVGPLCRIENWCEVEEVEELLLQAKKYRELLDLYNGKNMHEKAVKLLRQMSKDEDDPGEKVADTVRYLQKLGADHVNVIFEASKWVFEQDREAGLQIFIADFEEVESLPRHATMAHLEGIGRDVCIRYLEHIIHVLGEQGAEFHEKLIELYLAVVQASGTGPDETADQKLLDLLESSTSYRADRMLGRLPSEDMHQVRAILLGRLGRHEGALQIYVYQLEDHTTAEQSASLSPPPLKSLADSVSLVCRYCKRVYDSDESMRPTIFHLLLRIYLRPRPHHPLLFGPALALLSTHAARIDPIEAFDLLPPLVALGDIQVYLEKTLRRSGERKREAQMVAAVGRSWIDQKERELVDLEERRVKITEGRVCPVCHKRIGNSVIAIHNPQSVSASASASASACAPPPLVSLTFFGTRSGEVTHYQCREQFQELHG